VAHAEKKGDKKVPPVLNFKMKSLDGKDVDLSKYQGKVIMFVNVASKCGYTKQYKELQAIYKKYEKEGFVIIGVPANEFGKQEPGTDEEIAEFCSSKYNVTFPLLSKVVVKGKGIAPLYEKLTSDNPDVTAGIKIVLKALESPIRQIAQNAGVDSSIVVGKVLESKSNTFGFDAQAEEYKDLVQAGIIDPTKVVRHALQDAASVAGLLITTEAMVAEKPEPKSAMPAMPPGGGMGGMDF